MLNLVDTDDFIEVPNEEISFEGDFTITPHLPPAFDDEKDFEVLDLENDVTSRPFKAEDGVNMLAGIPNGLQVDSEERCKEAERRGMGFTIFVKGEMVACAGIIKQREGVGLCWALFPSNIGKFHIDPRIARDKLKELMDKQGLWRIEATSRADFLAGQSYLRWLGFEREGLMKKAEPDKTDSILYAKTR